MARTITPPAQARTLTAPSSADSGGELRGRTAVPGAATPVDRRDDRWSPPSAPADGDGDNLPTKLVKYIPGETLAFFVPAAALAGTTHNTTLIVVAVVAMIGGVGWLWLNGQKEKPENQPLVHFYPLAAVSFAVWALATAPNFAALLGFDAITTSLLLTGGVFLIPLLDGVLTTWRVRN